ncbi:hypothetical protein V8F20_009085 [Naviculisporaceae sp. PSN 640]
MKSSVNISISLLLLISHTSTTYTHNMIARQQQQPEESDLIDPVQQASCTGCWQYGAPPSDLPGCPVVKSTTCPDDENASDNMTGGQPKCGIWQYNRDCYCNLKTPISCAWRCNWEGWWETEDWFANVCGPSAPAAKQVDWSSLPSCARQCLDDSTFQYGCLTQTSNCVCTKGDLFDCHKKCGDQAEWDAIAAWLRDTCAISQAAASEALKTGQFALYEDGSGNAGADGDRESPPPLPGREPLRWDEIFVLCAAGLVGVTVIVLWVGNCVGGRRRVGKNVRSKVAGPI